MACARRSFLLIQLPLLPLGLFRVKTGFSIKTQCRYTRKKSILVDCCQSYDWFDSKWLETEWYNSKLRSDWRSVSVMDSMEKIVIILIPEVQGCRFDIKQQDIRKNFQLFWPRSQRILKALYLGFQMRYIFKKILLEC